MAIQCTNLTKTYGKQDALHEITCEFKENVITGLIGRNGAGKTTLLKTIAGYYAPTSGSVTVFGTNPYESLLVSANMIFIDQSMALIKQPLEDTLALAQAQYVNWDNQLAYKLMDYFNLDPKKLPTQLSKGMLSTFKAILGICARCPLTIMDEPTSGMDAAVRQDFYRALLKDYMAHPRTIILSSHLLNEIEELLEDIVLLDQGLEILSAPVLELQQYAIALYGKQELVSQFVGNHKIYHSQTNIAGYQTVITSNSFSALEQGEMQQVGIEFSNVSASDLCLYITNRKEGGIDHVFDPA